MFLFLFAETSRDLMKKEIDLRSDTVTLPTDRMREAMRNAIVGDDVLGEDPTVKKLEEKAAELFNQEEGLFLVSGTMANQVAVMTLCQRGDQIIVHNQSHIYNLEVGGLASTCGVQTRAIPARGGRYDLGDLEKEIHPGYIQKAPTTLICLENTFDLNRGLAVPYGHVKEVCDLAKRKKIKVYLDGARIFNASVVLRTPVARLSAGVDAVAFCLPEGLACPVGSLLLGPRSFITEARRMRQRLGGGWRQAGLLAAAGMVALEEMIDRLSEDHDNARSLARGLISLGLEVDLDQVQTNIIHVDLKSQGVDTTRFCTRLKRLGVKVKSIGPFEIRMVTHKDFKNTEIQSVLDAVHQSLKELKAIPH